MTAMIRKPSILAVLASALVFAAPAFAHTEDTEPCEGKADGDACTRADKTTGTCQTDDDHDELSCVVDGADDSGGCSTSGAPGSGGAVFAIAMAAGLCALRRRRSHGA